MAKPLTYLDYNATAPAKAGVADAIAMAVAQGGNPSSVHGSGRAARRLVEDCRAKLAMATGAKTSGIVFTSGGTEANRLALTASGRSRILACAVEHPAVTAHCLPENLLPVDTQGRIQPVAEAAAIAHAAGALLHCDAVQGLGKLPIDLSRLGADMLSVSAHKIGGPAGVGALILAQGITLTGTRAAGGQEQGRRPGTENLAGIAGFGAALDHLAAGLADLDRQAALRERLEHALAPDAIIFAQDTPRLANTVCVAMPGVTAETQVMAFDLAGFCVSAGAACSSGKVQASPVLLAMGVAPDLAATAIRVSFGQETTADEIDAFAAQWKLLCQRKRAA